MAQQRLYSACKSGDLKDIKQLHARGDVHPSFSSDIFLITWTFTRPDSDGRTPLFIAYLHTFFGAKIQSQLSSSSLELTVIQEAPPASDDEDEEDY